MRRTHSLISPASAPISGPYIDTRRAHSRSRSPPPKRHRSENRGKRRDSPQQARAEKVTNDSNADSRIRLPQHVLTTCCVTGEARSTVTFVNLVSTMM